MAVVRRIMRDQKPRKLRAFQVGSGLPDPMEIAVELQDMVDVLLGREHPPIEAAHLTLMEVADAYYARAAELTMLILAGEREGRVTRGSALYKMRTGELRTFMELSKNAADLGSRRLTAENLRHEQSQKGRESHG